MRAVAQRVAWARVRVAGELVAEIDAGLLALVSAGRGDRPEDARELAHRLLHLRVFEDEQGRMNRSLLDTGGALAVVSQFTLHGDARRGRRPSFASAAPAERAEPLVETLAERARALGARVATGRFGARMEVELLNSGPVTILLDTEKRF